MEDLDLFSLLFLGSHPSLLTISAEVREETLRFNAVGSTSRNGMRLFFFHGLSFSKQPGVKWSWDQKQMNRSMIMGGK
jgi:hypothetical protein